ncbi:MAG: MoaD/ThiS family protein [Campylobacterales bacterium]
MVTVEFVGPISRPPMELEASTLAEVAEELRLDSGIAMWLESSAVAVNDRLVSSLDIPLKSGDRITLLPPVCGG